MSRRVLWLQLLLGWLPVWALFASLLFVGHRGISVHDAVSIASRMLIAAALLGILVARVTERVPWQRPVRSSFVGIHVLAAFTFAACWIVLNSLMESVLSGSLSIVVGPSLWSFVLLGVWLYVMIAGVAYTAHATERASRAEALAARSQLAALRSQLNPHFLFNALHAVVHLIPREPGRAAQAAEQLAALLRRTIEEDRDLVPLEDEWTFVERYLELERLRFGDRLRIEVDMSPESKRALVPLFSVQTLVENAVRHGVEPRVEPTVVRVHSVLGNGTMCVTVSDTGEGVSTEALEMSKGTGLRRLRERLSVLYGRDARLDLSRTGGGFSAMLVIPGRDLDE